MQVHLQIDEDRKARFLVAIVFVILFSSDSALACEEIPGSNFTANNHRLVVIYAVTAIAALLSTSALYFVRRRRGLLAMVLSLVLLFFHPVWYFGGGGGDCGRWFVQLAEYLMIAVIGLLALQIILWRFRRPRNDRSGAELGRAAERAQGS